MSHRNDEHGGIFLDSEECHIVEGALRAAAALYSEHAVACTAAGQSRLAEQFERQRDDALRLAEQIENVS